MGKPAPIGNQYAARSRMLEQALRRVVMQDDGKRLRRACETAMTKAAGGSLPHLEFIANRLDGAIRRDDAGDDGDTRSISLNDLMRAIVRARAADAETIEPAQLIAPSDQPVEPDQA